MDAPRNIESPRRGILLAITPFAILTALIMYLFFDQRGWSTMDIAFEGVLVLICLCLVLTLVNPTAFWWAPRIVAFIIFASYLGYLVYELTTQPFVMPRSRGAANPINAVLGFCVFGIPCLLYALSGSTIGPIAEKTDEAQVTLKDIQYLQIANAARWTFLAVSAVVVAVGLTRAIVS
jgi:phosphatidylglycerophosphate synthase